MRKGAIALVLSLVASGVWAQFAQYTVPGSLAEEQVPTRDRLKSAMDTAPYQLGPLRLGPWFALKDVAYVNNVFGTETDQQSDLTATVGGGVHAYLPLGHRLTLGMYALPEYVWWRNLSNRRGWNGDVGAGLFGYFNRITVEVLAGNSRHQQYASSELQVPANLQDRRASALVEVAVVGQMSLFARARSDHWRYVTRGLEPDQAAALVLLDRDESRVGGGIRFHFTKAISLGVGVERYTTDFVRNVNGQSNSGPAPIAELSVETARVFALVSAIALDLKPTGPADFARYTGTNGDFQIGFRPSGKVILEYYGGRSLAYSIDPATPYYLDERAGLAVQSALGWRATARMFWEKGRNAYVAAGGGPGVADRLTGYGGTITFGLGREASFDVGGSRVDYSSPAVARNRSVTQIQASLRLMSGKAQWW